MTTFPFPHTCSITQPILSRTKFGGAKESRETIESDVECWVQPSSVKERMQYERRDQEISHTVYFKSDKSLKPKHEIVWDGFDKTLVVIGYTECTLGLSILFKAICLEIRSSV